MSLMLRRGIEALVGVALVVAMLTVLPAVAKAQSAATPQEARDADANPAARVVVVAPGDSLWSISAEGLGAGATPQQVAEGVERIQALNRDQIGPDPNLIFAGQRLSLPAMGSADAPRPDAKVTPPAAREDSATAAATSPKGGSADHAIRNEKAPAVGSEAPSLPKVADAAPAVPAVRKVASEDSRTNGSPVAPLLRDARSVATSAASTLGETLTLVGAAADDRRTLGWTILALTVVVGALMAWKLPMKRTTRWDAERWGMPTGFYGAGSYPSNFGNLDMPAATRGEREQPRYKSLAGQAPVAFGPTANNGSKANGSGAKLPAVVRHDLGRGGVITRGQAKRRQQSRAAARGSRQSVVRKGLVTGVNSAEFHRALRVLLNRRAEPRKPPNGRVQAARNRRLKLPNGGTPQAQRRVSGGR